MLALHRKNTNNRIMGHLKLYTYPNGSQVLPVSKNTIQSDFVGYFLCVKGSAELLVDMKKYVLKEGSICVVLPYSTISVESHSPDLQGLGITTDPQILDSLKIPNVGSYFLGVKNCPVVDVANNEADSLYELSMLIIKKQKQKNINFHQHIVHSLTVALCYEIASYYQKYSTSIENSYTRQDDIFRNFINLVYKNFKENRSLEFYANKMFLTTRYLSSVIKQKTGTPASHWVTAMVITEAKNLLKNSNLSVQQIAIELNFPNASFFGQYFRKYAGCTPNDYRRNR